MAEFTNAIEAQKIVSGLRRQLSQLSYSPDLKKLLSNVDVMVNNLSKAELRARRSPTGKSASVESATIRLQTAIKYTESMILVAKLMQ